MKTLEFWFEFASTYSYLSAMRIDALANAHGVPVTWTPFLLGPIFKRCGWETSPFKIYKPKGDYMWRDMERRASRHGLPFRRPDKVAGQVFPQNGLSAARIATVGLKTRWGRDFCRAVFHAQFAQGRSIENRDLLFELARRAGAMNEELRVAFGEVNKAVLRDQTERAMGLGIFGAPSFVVGEELFWGDDRLEDALQYATDTGLGSV